MGKKTADKEENVIMEEFDREEATNVAEKLNEILGLEGDEVIDTDLEEEELQNAIGKAAALIGMDPKTDAFNAKLAEKDREDLGEDVWNYLEKYNFLDHVQKVEEKPTPAKKEKAKKEKDPNAPKRQAPKREGPRTKLGCFEGTQAGFMDELFLKGTTEADAIQAFNKEYSCGEAKAKARFKSHLKHLEGKTDLVEVVSDKNGKYTAKLKK